MPDLEKKEEEIDEHPVVQTYQSDLERAMDTTDAKVVQELLENAREREQIEKEKEITINQRRWYRAGGMLLIILAIGALGYGVYYYKNLTVSVEERTSVGIFQNIRPISSIKTPFQDAMREITSLENLAPGKPFLVPVVTDEISLTLLSKEELVHYIGARASEPFLGAISLVRLGVYNTGVKVSPFMIFSVPDPEIASKEFLIAEPNLLTMFAPVLNIDLEFYENEIGKGFTSSYMYNLPVRILKSKDPDTKEETILLYYGYATDNTIVLSTNPTILKAVYDTIIKQH